MNRRVGLLIVSILFAGFLAVSCGRQSPQPDDHPARPLIVFLSDFGTANDSAAICKGVIVSIAPDVRIMDVTHQVTPYSIEEGARLEAYFADSVKIGGGLLASVQKGTSFVFEQAFVNNEVWLPTYEEARRPLLQPSMDATFSPPPPRIWPPDGNSISSAPSSRSWFALRRRSRRPAKRASPARSSPSTILSAR